MGKLTTKLLSALEDDDELERLFAESEQALSVSRQVFCSQPAAHSAHSAGETSTADRWAALRLDMEGQPAAPLPVACISCAAAAACAVACGRLALVFTAFLLLSYSTSLSRRSRMATPE
jgi:phage tail sheath gpL-like